MAELDLKKTGSNYKALCPFHAEKTASFIVSPSRQTFHCFGCHEHGDVIAFIQKYKDLSFKDALSYLGINGRTKREIKPDSQEIRKKELIRQYRQWLNNYTDFLCNVLRRLDTAKMKAKTMKEVETIAWHYHQEPTWESHLEILLDRDEKSKFQIYKEMRYGNNF